MVHKCDGMLLSHEKKEIMPCGAARLVPRECHCELWERQVYDCLCVEPKKKDTKELICKTNRYIDVENKFMVTGG